MSPRPPRKRGCARGRPAGSRARGCLRWVNGAEGSESSRGWVLRCGLNHLLGPLERRLAGTALLHGVLLAPAGDVRIERDVLVQHHRDIRREGEASEGERVDHRGERWSLRAEVSAAPNRSWKRNCEKISSARIYFIWSMMFRKIDDRKCVTPTTRRRRYFADVGRCVVACSDCRFSATWAARCAFSLRTAGGGGSLALCARIFFAVARLPLAASWSGSPGPGPYNRS